jgi:hypothetical protein
MHRPATSTILPVYSQSLHFALFFIAFCTHMQFVNCDVHALLIAGCTLQDKRNKQLSLELESTTAAIESANADAATAKAAAAEARAAADAILASPPVSHDDSEKAEIVAENRALIADVTRLKTEMKGVLVSEFIALLAAHYPCTCIRSRCLPVVRVLATWCWCDVVFAFACASDVCIPFDGHLHARDFTPPPTSNTRARTRARTHTHTQPHTHTKHTHTCDFRRGRLHEPHGTLSVHRHEMLLGCSKQLPLSY